MIYLDYAATTFVNKEVLESFNKCNLDYIGNANSSHQLGINAKNLIDESTNQIINLLNLHNKELIYTSGATESNNLAIKGVAFKYQNRGKHIITTMYEHSSIYEPLNYLKKLGFEISYVKCDDLGIIDLNDLKKIIRNDTILVCVNAINSELGLKQPIEEIANFLKNYPKCFFHVDLTQAIGKININMENIDFASFTSHKIFGLKGIGCLIKRSNIEIEPLIHGGLSTTKYRSGTPTHCLIVSLAKALRLSMKDMDLKYEYVKKLNNYIKENLKKYPDVYINSNNKCIPYILNISILGIKSSSFVNFLSEKGIYISTKSACSNKLSYSQSVYNLTKNKQRAQTSLRISLANITTMDEINNFLKVFDLAYKNLKIILNS